MESDTLIALISPTVGAILAGVFVGLWAYLRRPYILKIAMAFACLALGFLVQFVTPLPVQFAKFLSNGLFLAAAIYFATGLLKRYNRPVPRRALGFIAGAGMTAFSYFLIGATDINARIFVVNFAFGSIATLLAYEIWKADARRVMDNVLLGTLCFWGATFFPRPFLIMWIDGPVGEANFQNSLYWMSMVLSGTVFMLVFALAIGGAIVGDLLDELTKASETDPLSQLLNRRGFEARLEKRLAELSAMGMPASLIACDIDHFKSVNDQFGHACGDLVIARFADCLRSAVEGQHLIGRMGGEEFAILLEHADARTAGLFAEGLRIAFAAAPVAGLPASERFAASFGVAETSRHEGVGGLFRRADQALYRAKNAGRDCVRIAPAPPALLQGRPSDGLSETA